MSEDRRYGKRPRLCENDGEAWSIGSDNSDYDPSIPVDGSRIPDDGTAARENDTAACSSAGSSPFFCDICKVPLASFDLSCQHLSVHLREERRHEEPTVAFEPTALGQQSQPEGTVYLAEPTDTPYGRIGLRFPASSNASADDGAIPSTTPTETEEATQASLSASDSYNIYEDEETKFFQTNFSPDMYGDPDINYNETIRFQYSIFNTIAEEAVPIASPQWVNNVEESHSIYEYERTTQFFPTALSPSIYESSLCLEPSVASTSGSVDGGATSGAGVDLAGPPDGGSDMETLPDVPRLAHRDVRPKKAARLSRNTLGKQEGQHQGSVQPDVDSVQQAPGQRLYPSEICKESFTCATHLKGHLRTHTNDRPYLCEICGRLFKTSSTFTKHRHTHTNDRPYRCELCGASFKRKDSLNEHRRTHINDRPYPCELCGASFKSKGNLIEHRRTHTNHRPYPCELCGKSFTTKTDLKRHRRTHTDDRTHACQICGKSFRTKHFLVTHQRTHTGEKPYSCDICGKLFTQKSNLKVHRRTHTGEKPYSCEICKKSFPRKDYLARHHCINTGEKP